MDRLDWEKRNAFGEPGYGAGYDEAWLEGIRKAVETSTEQRQAMARECLEKFSWEAVKGHWEEVLG